MNIKAAYYAFSRMLLPTITVIGLILLSTLSIETTFGFLMQKTWVSGLLRVALLAVELVWFYYLYEKKTEELALQDLLEKAKNTVDFKKYGDGSINDLKNYLSNNSSANYATENIVTYQELQPKTYLVKLSR